MFNFLHLVLIFLFIVSNISVYFSQNSVYSVLFMILSFVSSSMILFLFKIDFLALLYLIIYVGALAILFLFVIMMLNAKFSVSQNSYFYFILFLLSFFILSLLYLIINEIFSNFVFSNFDNFLSSDFFNNINSFGQILFNYYITIVLIAGLILLLALISSIALTVKQI